MLHLILFGASGPTISPFLHLFLLGGRDAFQLDLSFLSQTLDGTPLQVMKDWLLLAPSDPLWVEPRHKSTIYNVFLEAGMDVCHSLCYLSSYLH